MSRTRNTTTAPTGSIAPLGLRLLPELRGKIEAAARTHGRSLNAEVSDRLQASFEAPSTERIKDLELELAQQHAAIAAERAKALQYSVALMVIAARVPAEAFSDTPTIAAVLKEANSHRNAKIMASARQMLADAKQALADIDQVASGRFKPLE